MDLMAGTCSNGANVLQGWVLASLGIICQLMSVIVYIKRSDLVAGLFLFIPFLSMICVTYYSWFMFEPLSLSQAVDIFAAFSTSTESRLTTRKEISMLWAVPATVTETLYPPNKPIIKV